MIKPRADFQVDISEPVLAPLLEHIIAIDLGTELFDRIGVTAHKSMSVIIWLADDAGSSVLSAIREHVRRGNLPFKLSVKSGIDLFVYTGATLSALQHSIFTREDHSERISLMSDKGAEWSGTLHEPASRKHSAKLLQVSFAEVEHHIVSVIQ